MGNGLGLTVGPLVGTDVIGLNVGADVIGLNVGTDVVGLPVSVAVGACVDGSMGTFVGWDVSLRWLLQAEFIKLHMADR